MKSIDLNADIGEGMPNDLALLEIISSANIACGGHAGDEETIRRTLRAAHAKGVACGAHPGFVDKENFGRIRLDLTPQQLSNQIRSQMERFVSIAAEENVPVTHLKLHGALANMAAEDTEIARTAFSAAVDILPNVPILAQENSAQILAAQKLELPVIREAYADRTYTPQGLLTSRSAAGAVIEDVDVAVQQCIQIAIRNSITSDSGEIIKSAAQSICLHGDNDNAIVLAQRVRDALQSNNVYINAPYAS